jgi:hypothetical protein
MDLLLIVYWLLRGLMMMLRYKKFNQQLEFCNDYRGVPADKWQITGFNHLNQWFNNYVGVKPGYGLAAYLGYPNNIDNYIAVAWWLNIKMKYTKCPVYSMAELKRLLRGISPESFFES